MCNLPSGCHSSTSGTVPSGPGLPPPRDTLCVLGASWRCDTRSKESQSRPGRKASGPPRAWRTSPPPPAPPPRAPAPARRAPTHPGRPAAPAPSGRCRPRSSGPGSPWAPSVSTCACRWDTRAGPSSCSRTAAGTPGRSCGCTWAPRGPWRSRSKWSRRAPAPARNQSGRRQLGVAWTRSPWSSGRRRVSLAGRRHGGAAPWWGGSRSVRVAVGLQEVRTLGEPQPASSVCTQTHPLHNLYATRVKDQQGLEEQVYFPSSK